MGTRVLNKYFRYLNLVYKGSAPAPASVLSVDGVKADPVTSVRDLGIYIDADLSMRTHVQRTFRGVLPHLASCNRFDRCTNSYRQPRSRHWWSFSFLSRLDYGNGVLVGLPAYLVRRLQSVLNASARLTHHLRRSDHIVDALVSLHWLLVPKFIQYKIAVLTYKILYGTAPRYLGPLVLVSNLPGQRALRSTCTSRLVVPPFKLSTIGDRTFKVAAARTWNDLPEDVTSSSSTPSIFSNRLKTHLFR